MRRPWTRDGRVRADVVQIAPDVSGPVSSVAVRDNQWVNRGDVLYAIDPRWLKLAVLSAQADVEAKRHEMLMRRGCRPATRAHQRGHFRRGYPANRQRSARRGGQLSGGAGCAGTGAAEFIPCNGARPGYRLRDASSAPPRRLRRGGRDKDRRGRCAQFLGGGLF